MRRLAVLLASMLAAQPLPVRAQQVPDSAFAPDFRATWARGAGPVVAIDAGHHNFHTADAGFHAFAELLRRDGARVQSRAGEFTRASLDSIDVLVVANALAERNLNDWSLPTPSAFTESEIETLARWIHDGGALLLVADHMPFAGAAADLARRLGFEMRNGFAGPASDPTLPFHFRAADGTLRSDLLAEADGRQGAPPIDSVTSFMGQALRALAPDVQPLLVLPDRAVSLEPDIAWEFDESTPRVPVGGWMQAGLREVGRGRVVVIGEAAMLTAQLAGPERIRVGMNDPAAPQNYMLVLGVVRWLAGRTPPLG